MTAKRTYQIAKRLQDLSFDQYSRQYYAKRIVEDVVRPHLNDKKLSILDLGGYGGKTKDFFPIDDVTVLDVFDVVDKNYIKGDATATGIDSGSYDLVVSFDVMEHIPRDKRRAFISEAIRIAKHGVIIATPADHDDGMVSKAEEMANQVHKTLAGEDHRWLKEHIDFGIPTREEVEELLSENDIHFVELRTNPVSSWLGMQSLIFTRQILNKDDSFLGKDFHTRIPFLLNRFYNKNLEKFDPQREDSYRSIYFAAKEEKVHTIASKYLETITQTRLEGGKTDSLSGDLEAAIYEQYAQMVQLIESEAQRQIADLRASTDILQEKLDYIEGTIRWRIARRLWPLRMPARGNAGIVDMHNNKKGTGLFNYRRVIKKIMRPMVGPFARVLHLRLFGKHVFINKYTRRVPLYNKVLTMFDERLTFVRCKAEREQDYKKWYRNHSPRTRELAEQRERQVEFSKRPLISVLVPTYNPKPGHLRECIESVLAQTYENWELCLVDDASSDPTVRQIIEDYAKKDKRIKYTFRKANGHICAASNDALDLATGDFVALLDHDDYLWPNALFEVVKRINIQPKADFFYSDEDKIDEENTKHIDPFFKPDWSPELLRSINYITHFAVLRRSLVDKLGGFRAGYEGAQDWDLFLRVSRATQQIQHIPKVLYSWRMTDASTAKQPSAKDYAYVNQKKALEDDIKARGQVADLSWEIPFSMWRVDYKPRTTPLVSIIIPTKDQYEVIKQCLISIHEKTTYQSFETVIVDTGSTDKRVWDLYEEYGPQVNARVVKWAGQPFNFSEACDFGADEAKGDYFLFLNNDTEVISPGWIQNLLGYAAQEDVGAVGCQLFYPDGKLQHGGIILGVGGQNGTPGIAGHFFPAFRVNPPQDPAQLTYVGGTRNFAAVTAACVMVSKAKFKRAKGFDPKFRIAFNDVDFCLKLHKAGLRNVYLPHVQLYHHESISVGLPGSKQRDLGVFAAEIQLMLKKWGPLIESDPYYHPEFRRDIASARLKI